MPVKSPKPPAAREMPSVRPSRFSSSSETASATLGLRKVVAINSVSYTHLDVYKRQVEVYYYTPDSIRPYKKAKYRVAPVGGSYYPWQYDNCLLYTSRCIFGQLGAGLERNR